MAIKGNLYVNGHVYEVLQCNYTFKQTLDASSSLPKSRPQGGQLEITIPSTDDDNIFLYNWMFRKLEMHSGIIKLCVYSRDNRPNFKTIIFLNAYCTELTDSFNSQDSKLMSTKITLSARAINIGNGALFYNEWGDLGDDLTDYKNMKEQMPEKIKELKKKYDAFKQENLPDPSISTLLSFNPF